MRRKRRKEGERERERGLWGVIGGEEKETRSQQKVGRAKEDFFPFLSSSFFANSLIRSSRGVGFMKSEKNWVVVFL